MARTRKHHHDEIDDAQFSSSTSKRARRSFNASKPESKQAQGSIQESVNKEEEGGPSPAQTPSSSSPSPENSSHLSTQAPNEDVDCDSTHSERSSHHGRVPSGIEGFYFPDLSSRHSLTSGPSTSTKGPFLPEPHSNPSPAPSQSSCVAEGQSLHCISPSSAAQHPSGIEGCYFPDIPSTSPRQVPSGIKGYRFPDYYDIANPSSPPSSGSSSTLMGNSPTMPPEEAARLFERQYHFYDDPGAM